MADPLFVKKVQRAQLPTRAHGASMGSCLYNLYNEPVKMGEIQTVHTGICLAPRGDRAAIVMGELPDLHVGGLAVREDIFGGGEEIKLVVTNCGNVDTVIKPYSPLAKIMVVKCMGGNPQVVSELDVTERNTAGWGSTGTK